MTPPGTIQGGEFAEPVAYYTETAARCVCQATLYRLTSGEWVHAGHRVQCAKGVAA